MFNEINEKQLSKEIEKVSELIENGTLSELKPFIVPYFFNDFSYTVDCPTKIWNSMRVAYIFNWNKKFSNMVSWDFVTNEKMQELGLDVDEIHQIAIENLNQMAVQYGNFILDDKIPYYILEFKERNVAPAFDSSTLLSNNILEKLSRKLNSDKLYIFPLYQDFLFILKEEDLNISVKEVSKMLQELDYPYMGSLTKRIFSYSNGDISME